MFSLKPHQEFLVNCMALNIFYSVLILNYPIRIILAENRVFKYSGTLKQFMFHYFHWKEVESTSGNLCYFKQNYDQTQNCLVFWVPNCFLQMCILIFNNTILQRLGFLSACQELRRSASRHGITFSIENLFFN